MSTDVLVGIDWMKKHRMIIDIDYESVYLQRTLLASTTVSFRRNISHNEVDSVRLITDETFEIQTRREIYNDYSSGKLVCQIIELHRFKIKVNYETIYNNCLNHNVIVFISY